MKLAQYGRSLYIESHSTTGIRFCCLRFTISLQHSRVQRPRLHISIAWVRPKTLGIWNCEMPICIRRDVYARRNFNRMLCKIHSTLSFSPTPSTLSLFPSSNALNCKHIFVLLLSWSVAYFSFMSTIERGWRKEKNLSHEMINETRSTNIQKWHATMRSSKNSLP